MLSANLNRVANRVSRPQTQIPDTTRVTSTTTVLLNTVFSLGHTTFLNSDFKSLKYFTMDFLGFLERAGLLAVLFVSLFRFRCFFSQACIFSHHKPPYLVSLCGVCFLQNLQYLFISILSGSFFLFFLVL